MKLSKPTNTVFWISLILGILGLLAQLVTIPVLSPYAFWILLVGFILLVLGNTMKGF
jgi:hypothetical protein